MDKRKAEKTKREIVPRGSPPWRHAPIQLEAL
jgi:hypothetical protein